MGTLKKIEFTQNFDSLRFWKKNGCLHRDNDLPAFIYLDGDLSWYRNGDLHRDIGPAYISFLGKESEYYKFNQIYKRTSWDEILCKNQTYLWDGHNEIWVEEYDAKP